LFITISEGWRENPSTAFFKNREKDTLEEKTDSMAQLRLDTLLQDKHSKQDVSDVKTDSTTNQRGEFEQTGNVAVSADSVVVQ
jgi:hypothetical protein